MSPTQRCCLPRIRLTPSPKYRLDTLTSVRSTHPCAFGAIDQSGRAQCALCPLCQTTNILPASARRDTHRPSVCPLLAQPLCFCIWTRCVMCCPPLSLPLGLPCFFQTLEPAHTIRSRKRSSATRRPCTTPTCGREVRAFAAGHAADCHCNVCRHSAAVRLVQWSDEVFGFLLFLSAVFVLPLSGETTRTSRALLWAGLRSPSRQPPVCPAARQPVLPPTEGENIMQLKCKEGLENKPRSHATPHT